MQTLDFTPFYRSTVGFDRLFSRLDTMVGQEAKTYPPYNIERRGDDAWRVSIAVAGFTAGDLSIESVESNLVVKGGKAADGADGAGQERDFLHRGIAERSFELRFQLGDYVEVRDASLENGLLHVDLKREVPENKRPRQIEIVSTNAGSKAKTIDDKTAH